jgi:3'-phosphoadenosine 5'-phosphosulfate sulfotransferase (PAPS reductase)/FAD synthetase
MIRVFSYGGGVQSTAALVLAAQGVIDYHTFLFANVGEDSENPDTLAYVRARKADT